MDCTLIDDWTRELIRCTHRVEIEALPFGNNVSRYMIITPPVYSRMIRNEKRRHDMTLTANLNQV